jgi:hypothetical protein
MQRPDKRISEHVDFHRKSALLSTFSAQKALTCVIASTIELLILALDSFSGNFMPGECNKWEEKSPEGKK